MKQSELPPQTPQTLLEGAHSYAAATEILLRNPPETPLEALGLVAAHCTEIALKAALLASGRSEKELMAPEVRHNLSALWNMAVESGVPLEEDVPFWCAVLDISHASPFMFRYLREGWGVAVPQPQDLQDGLNGMLRAVERHVQNCAA